MIVLSQLYLIRYGELKCAVSYVEGAHSFRFVADEFTCSSTFNIKLNSSFVILITVNES